jgi:hypothetical protein
MQGVRAESDTFTATNPECARQWVAKGKKIVLIDRERKMMFRDRQSAPGKERHWRLGSNRGPDGLASENTPNRYFKNAGAGNRQCDRPKLSP